MAETKQVIVVRMDLKMGKGKLAAQVAHASLGAAEAGQRKKSNWYGAWHDQGQETVVVKAAGEADLEELQKRAGALGLPVCLIHDMGLTQVAPGTVTCLGIGPGPAELVDKVTGNLKLL